MLVDPPQSRHAHAAAQVMHHPHVGHPALAAQTSELAPGALLRQHFDQQVHGMHRGEQAQQMHAQELGRRVFAAPSASAAVRPARVDEIVGDKRIQEFEERGRAGGRKIGIHGGTLSLEI
jgi:hypothetical protein